jgi:hypothetical protein
MEKDTDSFGVVGPNWGLVGRNLVPHAVLTETTASRFLLRALVRGHPVPYDPRLPLDRHSQFHPVMVLVEPLVW